MRARSLIWFRTVTTALVFTLQALLPLAAQAVSVGTVTWDWSFGHTESGTLTTPGNPSVPPPAGVYAITGVSVLGSHWGPTGAYVPDFIYANPRFSWDGETALFASDFDGVKNFALYQNWAEGGSLNANLWLYAPPASSLTCPGNAASCGVGIVSLVPRLEESSSFLERVETLGDPAATEAARMLDELAELVGKGEFSELFDALAAFEDDATLAAALSELSPARLESARGSVIALSGRFHHNISRNVVDTIPARTAKQGGAVRHASIFRAFELAGLPGSDDESLFVPGDELPEVSGSRAQAWHAFVESMMGYGSEDDDGARVGRRWRSGGLQAGADYAMNDNLVLGLTGSYGYTDTSERGGDGSGDVHSVRAGPYIGFARGDWVIDAGTTFGFHRIDDKRPSALGGKARSDHDAWDVTVGANARLDWRMAGFRFGPITRLHYVHVEEDGFTERSGLVPLDIDSRDTDFLTSTLGLHAAWSGSGEGRFVVDAELGWVRQFLDDAETVGARFAGAPGGGFRTRLPEADRNGLRLALGTDLAVGESWRMRLGWEGHRAAHAQGHTGTLRFETRF